ncbi:hypothetical protein GCM10009609_05590 [Pseudonocardia aurantiaca]
MTNVVPPSVRENDVSAMNPKIAPMITATTTSPPTSREMGEPDFARAFVDMRILRLGGLG